MEMTNWEKNIRKVIPYVPGEQPKRKDIIKLNTNENPYAPSPMVKEVLENYDYDNLRLYPDPDATKLVKSLADTYGVEPENVFVGVGSDDVLGMAFLTCFNADKPILFPDITYSFYDVWADLFKIPYETQPLDNKLRINFDDYKKENGGIIFPNPNAPTGELETLASIEEVVKCNPDVVVMVDEAYIDFGGESALPLIHKYDNLLVIQTFSKSRAMAGIRIGYAFGSKKLIRYMNDVKFSYNSYTMNHLTIEAGCACLADKAYFEKIVSQVIATREWTKAELKKLGFDFGDSQANFIFAKHESVSAEKIYEAAREAGIFVRYFKKPRIDNYLRISIGTDEEMKRFVQFLQEYLQR